MKCYTNCWRVLLVGLAMLFLVQSAEAQVRRAYTMTGKMNVNGYTVYIVDDVTPTWSGIRRHPMPRPAYNAVFDGPNRWLTPGVTYYPARTRVPGTNPYYSPPVNSGAKPKYISNPYVEDNGDPFWKELDKMHRSYR